MRNFVALICFGSAVAVSHAQTAFVQTTPTALDLFNDFSRAQGVNYSNSTFASNASMIGTSLFSVGNVEFANQVLQAETPFEYAVAFGMNGTTGPATFYPDLWCLVMTSTQNGGGQYASTIGWNFGATSSTTMGLPGPTPANSVSMYSVDYIPAAEIVLPKGTYSFQSGATPIGGSSTPGIFQMQTLKAGVWTVHFSDKLTSAKTDERTVTFSSSTRVRWLLIRTGSAMAEASVVCRYQQTG